jgi:hypothetical protein
MDKHLDGLKRACRAERSHSDTERIDEGESIWLAGRQAAGEVGFISIAQDEDIRTIIREQDVQEVRKEGDFYLVRISTEQMRSCGTSESPRRSLQSAAARRPTRERRGSQARSLGIWALRPGPSACSSVPAGSTRIAFTRTALGSFGGG